MFKGGKNTETAPDVANGLNRFVEGTIIKGDITTESNTRIDGELVGNLSTTGKLVIGKSGKIEGNIICANADIEGKVIGTIKVDGILVIKSTANIQGDILTSKIKIDENAIFNGKMSMESGSNQKFESKIELEEESEIVY